MTRPDTGLAASLRPVGAPALIVAVAFLIMVPEYRAGLTLSDSSGYTVAWTDQFTALVRHGTVYPRWLPWSWHGLGSPAFYFYPPIFFWLEAAVAIVGGSWLPGTAAITTASALMLAVSGLAMRGWLRGIASARAALAGALAYMASPYHLLDIYLRGAVAEACAYAMLPLLLLAMRRAATGRGGAVPVALGYAGLICTHLPVALLASVSILPAYGIRCLASSDERARVFARLAGGMALGLLLAAAYVVPALSLTGAISSRLADRGFYASNANVLLNAAHWTQPSLLPFLIGLVLAAASLAALGAAMARSGEARFWAVLTLAMAALIVGLVPGVWRIPGLAQVQFPWRMLLIVDVAVISAVAAGRSWPLAIVALVPLGLTAWIEIPAIRAAVADSRAGSAAQVAAIRSGYRDAPEYLPASFRLAIAPGQPARADQIALPTPPLAAAPRAVVTVRTAPDGGMDVVTRAPSATRIVVARFRFPHWALTQDDRPIAMLPPSDDGLVGWRVPAGVHRYRLRIASTGPERLGWALSIAAAVTLAGLTALARQRRRRLLKLDCRV